MVAQVLDMSPQGHSSLQQVGLCWRQHFDSHLHVFCRSEVFLMMRTLRDMNMSKFVAEDVPLFLSLIEDLFPGLKADRAQFPDISSALEKVTSAFP